VILNVESREGGIEPAHLDSISQPFLSGTQESWNQCTGFPFPDLQLSTFLAVIPSAALRRKTPIPKFMSSR
jgi:hypothetical protein